MRLFIFVICLSVMALGQASTLGNASPVVQGPVYISIIIDDIGYNSRDSRFVELNAPLTLAVLPHTPHAVELANMAHARQMEIMLHMPMTSVRGVWPGPGTLRPEMGEAEFIAQVRDNIKSIPNIAGVNNHMGSELTPSQPHMQWLMRELRAEGVGYFIDSMTSRLSRARSTAAETGIPTLRRDVFLDNIRTEEAIRAQFQRMLRIAHQRGYAIAIGHPYDETWKVLQEELARLDGAVQLVPVSSLFKLSINQAPVTWHASSSP